MCNTKGASYEIERLIKFGLKLNMIEKWDVIPVRNSLMDLLSVSEPYEAYEEYEGKQINETEDIPDSPVEILDKLLDYALEVGIIEDNSVTYRDLLDAKIMGLLMPRQSEIVRGFYETAKSASIMKATDDFYSISKSSNYIRMDRIAKNLEWKTAGEYGDIDITVNLSKPEKDPKAIAAARNAKQTNYPKCLLCLENVGFSGNLNHPARQNHRVIPMDLDGEQWFFQYSPYVYYNEHCIVFHEKHIPMKISDKTFRRLLDFVEQFPHYFLGSNADLPIVGGSILTHDHFQGGHYKFAMEIAPTEKVFNSHEHPDLNVGLVKWPMSVIRLSSKSKQILINTAVHILNTWREYTDPEADIFAYTYTQAGDKKIPHNTVTPIARVNNEGLFELDLVLRNNRTSDEHPDGIFHPHKELHHIKKENIGLIEVMGLAVLPGRLDAEMKPIIDILVGERDFNKMELQKDEEIAKHLSWIEMLVKKYGTEVEQSKASAIVKEEIGKVFIKVLEDSGVYKRDENGKNAFVRYMKHAGFSGR